MPNHPIIPRPRGAGFPVDSAPKPMLPIIERALRARIVEMETRP
jgi:hypothetical protein